MSLDSLAAPLDLIAIAYFFLAIGIYRLIVSRAGLERRSLIGAVQQQRVRWMLNMAGRDNRMLDAILLGSLGQGNAFFASTSAIAVGGLTATLGSGAERLQYLLDALPLTMQATPVVWAAKQLLIMAHFRLCVLQVRLGVSTFALCLDHDRRDARARRDRRRGAPGSRRAHGPVDRASPPSTPTAAYAPFITPSPPSPGSSTRCCSCWPPRG